MWGVYLLFSAFILLLVIGALVDIVTRDDGQVRHLPKMAWVLLVVFLPLVGSIVWFLVGREWSRPRPALPFGDPRRAEATRSSSAPALGSTEAQLAALEAEIAAAEREERIRRLEAELEAKRRRAARD